VTLTEHARRELHLIGEDADTTDGIVRVVQAFADMGHSGASAMFCIPVVERLLRYQPLGPLTNDPDEWMHIEENIAGDAVTWQSRRRPDAFSNDGGKTYYCLDEERRWVRRLLRPLPWALRRRAPRQILFPLHTAVTR
jgi:hypothetical protein